MSEEQLDTIDEVDLSKENDFVLNLGRLNLILLIIIIFVILMHILTDVLIKI